MISLFFRIDNQNHNIPFILPARETSHIIIRIYRLKTNWTGSNWTLITAWSGLKGCPPKKRSLYMNTETWQLHTVQRLCATTSRIFQPSKSVCAVLAPVFQTLDGTILQGPVVQKVNNAIHWTSHYPLKSAIGSRNTHPLDNDLSGG